MGNQASLSTYVPSNPSESGYGAPIVTSVSPTRGPNTGFNITVQGAWPVFPPFFLLSLGCYLLDVVFPSRLLLSTFHLYGLRERICHV